MCFCMYLVTIMDHRDIGLESFRRNPACCSGECEISHSSASSPEHMKVRPVETMLWLSTPSPLHLDVKGNVTSRQELVMY